MRKNLDPLLIRFLKYDEPLHIEDCYGKLFMYRFDLIDNHDIILTSNDLEFKCSLGDFEKISNISFKLNYLYQIDLLIKNQYSNNSIINILESMYPPNDIRGRLAGYLERK